MPTEALAAHSRRTVRAFLRQAEEDDPEVWEFWTLIYGEASIDHATAVKVEKELAECTRTVREVLEGWRPEALTADPRTEASRYALPAKREERRPWHADGCPGATGCTCGGELTDAELGQKMHEAWEAGK